MKKIKIFVCCTEQSGENICSNILSRMNIDKYQFDGVCGKKSEKYEEGVACPNCNDKLSKSQKSRFRMRQSQIYKAKQSGKKYIFQKEFK